MAPTPRILATSGGFVTAPDGTMRPGALFAEALRLTGVERPKVCLLMTASGDHREYLLQTYAALSGWSVDVSHLELFWMPNAVPSERIAASDLIWVGGGSVANLLALWRVHGIDEALAEAWQSGTVLAGTSAGSICWHVGGPTDSFGPELKPVLNALAWLPYGNGVHYDSEAQRRPAVHRLVAEGAMPTTYATDDGIGILYEGTDPVAVLADSDEIAASGSAAYRIERVAGEAVETRLPVGPLTA